MGVILNRDQILESVDLRREEVEVPEWGGTVLVSEMTGVQRDAYEAGLFGDDRKVDLRNARARLVAACLIDPDGNPLFTDKDVEALGRKSAAALDRVCAAAQRLNLMTAAALEADAKN